MRIIEIGSSLACIYLGSNCSCNHENGVDRCAEPHAAFPDNCPLPIKPQEDEETAPSAIHNNGYITALIKEVEEFFYVTTGVVLSDNLINKLRSRLHSLKAANDT